MLCQAVQFYVICPIPRQIVTWHVPSEWNSFQIGIHYKCTCLTVYNKCLAMPSCVILCHMPYTQKIQNVIKFLCGMLYYTCQASYATTMECNVMYIYSYCMYGENSCMLSRQFPNILSNIFMISSVC